MRDIKDNDKESKDSQDNEKLSEKIEELIRHKAKIEEELKNKFTKDVTIMFTDIYESTSFFEAYGDIDGLTMVQRHNDILFPIISQFQGKVLKTIGDALMVLFDTPENAVRAAIEAQRKLHDYNKNKDKKEQILIRVGINFGKGIVETSDVYGDVVNIAARIESLAEPEQILISKSVYEKVKNSDEIICRQMKSSKVKGKTDKIELYRVIWGEEDVFIGKTRAVAENIYKKRIIEKTLVLEISREEDKFKASVFEKTGSSEITMRHYEESRINEVDISRYCNEITELLARATRKGKISNEILAMLRRTGQSLFDLLLPKNVKRKLSSSDTKNLILNIEDNLVQIPWELLYDGKEFLCLKFNIGRVVTTKYDVSDVKIRKAEKPLKMLIISDPMGDLPSSYIEGQKIRDLLDEGEDLINANLLTDKISPDFIKQRMRSFDIIHYAGHALYDAENPSNSRWLLKDGNLKASEILNMGGLSPFPSLVFSNACQTGQTEEWRLEKDYENQIYGLANAFLLSGVQHYIGTFWDIRDEPSNYFAISFYREIIKGVSIGEAMRNARLALVDTYGYETIVWASYMLYGDPNFRYIDLKEEASEEEKKAEQQPAKKVATISTDKLRDVTLTMEGVVPSSAKSYKKVFTYLGVSVLTILFLVSGIYFYRSLTMPEREISEESYRLLNTGKVEEARLRFERIINKGGKTLSKGYEGLAAVFFLKGDYQKAEDFCNKVATIDTQNLYIHVIKGNIFSNQGRVDEATSEYKKATESLHGEKWQRAEAFNKLGIIYASQNQSKDAMDNYDKALKSNSQDYLPYANKAALLGKEGKYEDAINLYKNALSINPNDEVSKTLLSNLERKSAFNTSKEKQERIDKLISDLISDYEKKHKNGELLKEKDVWRSKPITSAFIDFENKGGILARPGEDEFLLLTLTNLLQEKGRVKVIEREALDKVLGELKLSTSSLADKETALKVGKILAVKLISTGSILRYGNDLQINMRMIEADTSEIKIALAESYAGNIPLSKIASDIAIKISNKIVKGYPLKGEVASIDKNGNAVINIGTFSGVVPGVKMKVIKDKALSPAGENLAGEIEITSVDEETSSGKIIKGEGMIKKGTRLIEDIN